MAHTNMISKHGLITKTTLDDCFELNFKARPQDRAEVEDISGETLLDNLEYGLKHAKPCLTARTHSGALLGIFGVIPLWCEVSSIAFIGTKEIERNKYAFLRGARDALAYVEKLPDCRFLTNLVDCRNELHIKFLKRLGFHMHERIENFNQSNISAMKFWNFPKSP